MFRDQYVRTEYSKTQRGKMMPKGSGLETRKISIGAWTGVSMVLSMNKYGKEIQKDLDPLISDWRTFQFSPDLQRWNQKMTSILSMDSPLT